MANKASDILKLKKLSITKARVHILDTFIHNHRPLSIIELKKQKELKDFNESSLYRNLTKLVDADILRVVPSINEFQHYELIPIGIKHHHHHIICSVCEKIQCLSVCMIDSVMEKMTKDSGFKVSGHSLEIYGLCSSCQ